MINTKIEVNLWENGGRDVKEIVVCDDIKSFSVSYDGGRLNVYINNNHVYYTALAGNDCSVNVVRE